MVEHASDVTHVTRGAAEPSQPSVRAGRSRAVVGRVRRIARVYHLPRASCVHRELERDGEPRRRRHRRLRAAGRDHGRARGGESPDEVRAPTTMLVAEDAGVNLRTRGS